ncbi:hypothetical protein P7C70_g157, partial [Phenoliferia sp. Uapishka_3]
MVRAWMDPTESMPHTRFKPSWEEFPPAGGSIGPAEKSGGSGTLGAYVECGGVTLAMTNAHIVGKKENKVVSPSLNDTESYISHFPRKWSDAKKILKSQEARSQIALGKVVFSLDTTIEVTESIVHSTNRACERPFEDREQNNPPPAYLRHFDVALVSLALNPAPLTSAKNPDFWLGAVTSLTAWSDRAKTWENEWDNEWPRQRLPFSFCETGGLPDALPRICSPAPKRQIHETWRCWVNCRGLRGGYTVWDRFCRGPVPGIRLRFAVGVVGASRQRI